MIDLSVDIAWIKLKNPIMPASGTFGYGDEYLDFVDPSTLGAVVIKGTSLLPREGNPQPRMAEVYGGIINFIGLQNPGAEATIREKIPIGIKYNFQIIVNISGSTVEEYGQLAEMFDKVEGVVALEVNISCPNIKQGGVLFGQDPKMASFITYSVRRKTSLPIIVKLTPNVADNVPIAIAVRDAGADAISLINTLKARARLRNYPSAGKSTWIEGGLSGSCIMPVALRQVSDLYKAKIGIPIIGIGGISSTENVLDFLESGADAVQIGTANFPDPSVMARLIKELSLYIEKTGCESLKEWREKGFPTPKEKKSK